MSELRRGAPQIPVVLASLLLWFSFAWGLPAEAPTAEGDADVAAAEDTWECDPCGTANDASAKYCRECGAEKAGEARTREVSARSVCVQCGFEAGGDVKFCPNCGKRFEAAVEDPWAGVRLSAAYSYAECPRCGMKNELLAESCSRCGDELPQPSAGMTDPGMVFVPGKGYYARGTLLEPAKARKGLWVTGLVLTVIGSLVLTSAYFAGWLALVPGLVITGVGVPLLVVGLVTRTEPVYAFESDEVDEPFSGIAYALRSPDADAAALKIEVALLSF